ncbi:PIR Superfamily Protein [Plasmodium ovale curtisi]|uniref:PIR Superfamily Protein n=1 Tax=Plasmodium ovale curtisi TaxID=864141 RepID=A0A1A8X8V3_PLAOA|nr:PIR Superfamily Protein [Plasmodium ovale curtisi]
MAFTFQYDNIDELTSNKRYKMLDNNFSDNGKYLECKKLDQDIQSTEIYDFCMKVTGNLNNYDKLTFFDLFYDYRCKYLNLWLYDRLKNYNVHSAEIKLGILKFWKEFKEGGAQCREEFIEFVGSNEDDYNKTKRMYDYALNYQMIEFHYDKNKKACTKDIHNYIENSTNLYKQIKQECTLQEKKHNKCCIALDDIKKVYPHDTLWKFTCNEVVTPETANVLEKISKLCAPETNIEACIAKINDRATQLTSLQNSMLKSPEPESCSSGSHKAMAIAFPFLGIVFFLFIFYKFSPIGSWLHSILLRRKINKINIDEELEQETLDVSFDHIDKNSYNNERNIGNIPLGNRQ